MMTPTTLTAPSHPHSSPLRLLSCVRFDEVCVLQGAPLMGAMFSMGAMTGDGALALAALMAGSFSLVAHTFVFNDWSGIHGDLRDPDRANRTFLAKGVCRNHLGYFAVALLLIALLLFSLVGMTAVVIGVVIAAASGLYSAPTFHMKGLPVFSSMLHFVGGASHFMLGYAAFSGLDARGLAIGCFFALAFTAGHFTHESRGYEGDFINGIRTNAVAFGKTQSFIAGLVLFTAAYMLLTILAAFDIVPRLLLLAATLYPLHLWMSLRAFRAGLTVESLSRLQTFYRALYALIGVTMVVSLLAR